MNPPKYPTGFDEFDIEVRCGGRRILHHSIKCNDFAADFFSPAHKKQAARLLEAAARGLRAEAAEDLGEEKES